MRRCIRCANRRCAPRTPDGGAAQDADCLLAWLGLPGAGFGGMAPAAPGLALGEALDSALGNRKGISRYGWCLLPMDETLSQVAIDLGGRPYLVLKMTCRKKKILEFELALLTEFFRAFTTQARLNLHINQLYGSEPHHAWESVFKGVARALRMAVERDTRVRGVPSSKGTL